MTWLKFRLGSHDAPRTHWRPDLIQRRTVHSRRLRTHLSMMTGSDGVSFLLPQLFLSQHRLQIQREVSLQVSRVIFIQREIRMASAWETTVKFLIYRISERLPSHTPPFSPTGLVAGTEHRLPFSPLTLTAAREEYEKFHAQLFRQL